MVFSSPNKLYTFLIFCILKYMNNESTEQFKIEVDQNNILHLKLGNVDSPEKLNHLREWSQEVKKTVVDIYKKTGKEILAIIDTTELEKYDSEAFLILTDLMKANESFVLKTASFGGNPDILLAQDTLLAMSGRKNFKMFKTKEEALAWLTSS